MPIPHDVPQIVMVLTAPGPDGQLAPVGTGFVVGLPIEEFPGRHFCYLVTARHVVTTNPQLHARVSMGAEVEDVPIGDWVMGDAPAEDIALAPFELEPAWTHTFWSTKNFLTDDDEAPFLGDSVYFMGLLQFVPDMAAQNVPMVRSGTLGAMNQTGVPALMPDRVVVRMKGHLIDCRAYRGFSGSPCFVQDPSGTTRLLGVVSAHFDSQASVPLSGDGLTEGMEAQVPIHSGVGVVTPVELLLELLGHPDLAKARNSAVGAFKNQATQQP